jgi:GR25 family glycosyltransferase involved in LPS biosynthesis
MKFQAFLINLDRRPDRLAAGTGELTSVNIPFTRFPAIVPANQGNFKSIAARGCTESHIRILTDNGESADHLLIMEDDLFFCRNFTTLFPLYLKKIESLPEWDIVSFYNSNFQPLPDDTIFLYNFCSWCCHFYLVNHKSISKLAGLLTAADTIIDNEFFELFRDKKLSFWSAAQQLVFQDYDFISDIDPQGELYFKEGHLQGIYISKTKYRKEKQ